MVAFQLTFIPYFVDSAANFTSQKHKFDIVLSQTISGLTCKPV